MDGPARDEILNPEITALHAKLNPLGQARRKYFYILVFQGALNYWGRFLGQPSFSLIIIFLVGHSRSFRAHMKIEEFKENINYY